jgi:hypothetical protein
MKVFCTFLGLLRLAFWLFVLGVAVGLALRLSASGDSSNGSGQAFVGDLRTAVPVGPALERR